MTNSILIDTTKCTGCERCVAACIDANKLDPHKADIDRAQTEDGLSSNRWANIQKVADDRFARKSCMHCLEPSCVSACLVGGITKTPEGPVVYDPTKCIGCRYCMLACPFHIPRYEWENAVPYMRKCDMCFERVQQGGKPACVDACPNGALVFGSRKELLQKAQEIVAANGSTYIPHVWGETEFGGTSVLYISDEDLSALGWPEPQTAAIPGLTEPLISKTPFIGLGVATCLLSVNWIVRRRMKLAGEIDNHEVERND
ncbi:MAG: 4Fe-4S dicluster domain-containing protein [bacterium]|nr:4Fe-4S dicluster domain-containing protein [bacterium]